MLYRIDKKAEARRVAETLRSLARFIEENADVAASLELPAASTTPPYRFSLHVERDKPFPREAFGSLR